MFYIADRIYLNDQGCFKKDLLDSDRRFNVSRDLDPERCRELCRDEGIRYAAISFRDIVNFLHKSSNLE